jgi:hypothetical protein
MNVTLMSVCVSLIVFAGFQWYGRIVALADLEEARETLADAEQRFEYQRDKRYALEGTIRQALKQSGRLGTKEGDA